MGTSGGAIGGPYEARISPDGSRFAYYFYVQTSFDDYENDIRWIDTGSYAHVDLRRPLHEPGEPRASTSAPSRSRSG